MLCRLMVDERDSSSGVLGLAAVAIGLCCGLPILLAAGVALGAAGLVIGSSAVIAVAFVLALWGWRRSLQRSCPQGDPSEGPR